MESCLPGEKSVLILAFSLLWSQFFSDIEFCCPWEGPLLCNDLFEHFCLSKQQCPGTAHAAEPGLVREKESTLNLWQTVHKWAVLAPTVAFLLWGQGRLSNKGRAELRLREVCVPGNGCWEGNLLLFLSWDWGAQELLWEQHPWLSGCSLITVRLDATLLGETCRCSHYLLLIVAAPESHRQGSEPPCAGNWSWAGLGCKVTVPQGLAEVRCFSQVLWKKQIGSWRSVGAGGIYGQPGQYSPFLHSFRMWAMEGWGLGKGVCKPNSKGGVEWRWHILVANSDILSSACVFRKIWGEKTGLRRCGSHLQGGNCLLSVGRSSNNVFKHLHGAR